MTGENGGKENGAIVIGENPGKGGIVGKVGKEGGGDTPGKAGKDGNKCIIGRDGESGDGRNDGESGADGAGPGADGNRDGATCDW